MKLLVFLLTIIDGSLIVQLFSNWSDSFDCGVWAGVTLMVFYFIEGKVEDRCAT